MLFLIMFGYDVSLVAGYLSDSCNLFASVLLINNNMRAFVISDICKCGPI